MWNKGVLCTAGILHLKAASLSEGESSLPLLRSPASTQAGVPDDCLFVESRIEVEDDVWAFDEVNMEPAGQEKKGSNGLTVLAQPGPVIPFGPHSSQNAATVHDTRRLRPSGPA